MHAIYQLGLRRGAERAQARIAEAYDEIDATWRSVRHASYEERVQERIAVFEACYREINQRFGRQPGYAYEGGPSAWPGGA